jgi:hypothetical protein
MHLHENPKTEWDVAEQRCKLRRAALGQVVIPGYRAAINPESQDWLALPLITSRFPDARLRI